MGSIRDSNEISFVRNQLRVWQSVFIAVILCGLLCWIVLISPLYSSFPSIGDDLEIRLLTQNIRFDNKFPGHGEQPWLVRKKRLINSLDFNTNSKNSIICLQEALHHQIIDVLAGLNNNNPVNEEWTYYGVGRTDGKLQGEFAPILYKTSAWIVVESSTFWLSETPSVPSVGWDAVLPRIVSKLVLKSRENPMVEISFFNTHFDHVGKVARRHSAQYISEIMRTESKTRPSFLCGDLNTEPTEEPYQILTESGFKDSRILVNEDFSYGFESTFTGFDRQKEESRTIDYIWASPNAKKYYKGKSNSSSQLFHVEIRQFGILANYYKGFHFSDHRPVVANYRISRTKLLKVNKRHVHNNPSK
jgi:endonuclease/exonuclease/phosphatase family metal-dependent hydrolase